MDVAMWKIEDVKPYELNPRVNDPAVDAVIASIREFGWRQPIVVDAGGVIIVGHTRWKAAKKMGLAEVPVHGSAGVRSLQTLPGASAAASVGDPGPTPITSTC